MLNSAALLIQIVTGVVPAMHYAANPGFAFDRVEHVMRDVNWGSLLRYAHMNSASRFFASSTFTFSASSISDPTRRRAK